MRIGFLYTNGRLRRMEKVREGTAPTDFFHGSEELRAMNHEVHLFELAEETQQSLVSRVVDVLKRQVPMKVTGMLVAQARTLAPAISACDVLIVAGSGLAFAAELWRIMGEIKCPVIGLHCGLLNVKYPPVRKWTTRFLLKRTWTMLFGDGERDPLIDFFGIDRERVIVNQCGIDTDFWTPGEGGGDYVLAVGNDGRRDYELLMKAAAKCKEPFVVVTRTPIKATIPPNVKLVVGDFRTEVLSDIEMRELYRRARCVVTPLVETEQPSGQSVCLQAMSCGRPNILTQTEGLWSQTLIRSGENILLVPPYDAEAMAETIHRVCTDAQLGTRLGIAGRETVHREWTMVQYAKRLEECIRTKVLGGKQNDPEYEAVD